MLSNNKQQTPQIIYSKLPKSVASTNSSVLPHSKPIVQKPLINVPQTDNQSFRRYRQRLHLNGPVLASSQEINERRNRNENLINDRILHAKKQEQQNDRHVLLPADFESKYLITKKLLTFISFNLKLK